MRNLDAIDLAAMKEGYAIRNSNAYRGRVIQKRKTKVLNRDNKKQPFDMKAA